jgi:ectoine hydroxylase-related dioxygenase (phytanoyl-CoA dioxygenase family)
MSVAATVMTHPDAQIFLEERLVRPHLNTGDALIFDCRILHFGLSNWSHLKRESGAEKDWRIMMYVNYHQQWFQDPKNWNDAARLF